MAAIPQPLVPETEHAPSYRDRQLATLMRELRAACRPMPKAAQALARVEHRLRKVLRPLEDWDRTHAQRAETFLRLGQIEKANTCASMIIDTGLRSDLLRMAPIGQDTGAAERMAQATEMGREVLE